MRIELLYNDILRNLKNRYDYFGDYDLKSSQPYLQTLWRYSAFSLPSETNTFFKTHWHELFGRPEQPHIGALDFCQHLLIFVFELLRSGKIAVDPGKCMHRSPESAAVLSSLGRVKEQIEFKEAIGPWRWIERARYYEKGSFKLTTI